MKEISIIIIALFLVGCESTPQTAMPTYRMNSPEVNSEPLAVNIASGIGSMSKINLTNDNNSNSDDGNEAVLFIRASVVAVDGLKLIASGASNDGDTSSVTALYQFYGLKADQSVEGNFSQAVSLGYILSPDEGSYQSSAESSNTSWQQKTNIVDLAWIMGYRLTPQLLTYGGPFVQWANTKVKSSINSEEDELNRSFNKDYSGNLFGVNLALEYRFIFGLGLTGEVVLSKVNWSNSSFIDNGFNVKIDYQF